VRKCRIAELQNWCLTGSSLLVWCYQQLWCIEITFIPVRCDRTGSRLRLHTTLITLSSSLPLSLSLFLTRTPSVPCAPATSTTRKNTMAFLSRDWAPQQSLPPTNRGTTWPNCLLKLQSRTPRVLCNISCGPYSLRSVNDYNLRFELVPSPIGSHISLKLGLYLAPRNATEEQQLRRKYERMYATFSTYGPEGERYADRQVYQTHPRTAMSLQLARSHSLSSSRMYDTVHTAQTKWSSKSFCSPTKQLRIICAMCEPHSGANLDAHSATRPRQLCAA
jgi:hypothetical protein